MLLMHKVRYFTYFFVSVLIFTGCGGGSSKHTPPTVAPTVTPPPAVDPLFHTQWYLENTGQTSGAQNGGTAGEDIHVIDVWNEFRGSKVNAIAVLDTGIEATHPDLKDNLDLNLSYRYSDGSHDPSPISKYLPHGTAVAGIIAAKGWNGIGIRGVAPNAKLVGLNVLSSPTEANFIDALGREGMAVSSNSWGFISDELNDFETLVDVMQAGTQNGRNGKGTVYLFSAGNSRYKSQNANTNTASLTNNFYSMAIAAVNATGHYASYSNYGSTVLVAGAGGEDSKIAPAIVTTDLTGLDSGYDTNRTHYDVPGNTNGDYTNRMNGTSAACPSVSGVVALMLDANQNLSWRDVRYILAATARKNDAEDGNWTINGAGHHINYNYGFGMVDAFNAVEMSKTFEGLPEEKTVEISKDTQGKIPADGKTPHVSSLYVNSNMKIEFIDIWVTIEDKKDFRHIGDLEIILTSPQGTESTLAWGGVRTFGAYTNWRFGSTRHIDEHARGTWKLSIRDVDGDSEYTLTHWKLKIHGH